ncbi:toxin-antitoxin system YwqK family antitoxin [Pontibacter virosus]|nr:hypothetical protein [Pontibacter virosus]
MDQLQERKGTYYLNKKPFNGKAVSKFDNGNISGFIEFKNGIPNGKWIAYGYAGEIVQEGSFQPIIVNSNNSLTSDDIKRINLCTTREGAIEFTDVYVIVETNGILDKSRMKANVNAFLKSESISIKGDSINEIKIVKGEIDEDLI